MISIRQILREVSPWHRPKLPYDKATTDDLYYCYRLLLKREPDLEGWTNLKNEILGRDFPLEYLVDVFLKSAEFLNFQEQAAQPVLVEIEGINIYIRRNDFFIGAIIEKYGTYEPHVTDELKKTLKEGGVFVDIGANIGYFTLLAASLVGPQGFVHAFEPHSDNCESIQRSLEVNAFKNVTVYPFAIAESRKTFQLDVTGSSSNGRVVDFSPHAVQGAGPERLVEAITLDEILAEIDRIDVIKMDIEGAEPRAWQGMAQIVQRHGPVVIFEFSPHAIEVTSHSKPAEFLEAVISSGYDLFIINNHGGRTGKTQSPEQIIQRQQKSGLTHLDIIAIPLE